MQVTDLFIYPVKSLQGIRLKRSELFVEGLPFDRRWMLVDSKGGFVTQRQWPKLATVSTQITDTHLVLSHEKAGSLSIELASTPKLEVEVRVWQSELTALDEGLEVSEWLQRAIGHFRGQKLRLVRFNDKQRRPVKEKYLKGREIAQTYFADGFPYLITTLQTLNEVNQKLEEGGFAAIGMERFRPNIVVDTLERPFDELFDRNIDHIGGQYQLSIRKPCERCPVTTVDQTSGERATPTQPLTLLRELNPLVDKKGAYFGGNAILITGDKTVISVGDNLKSEVIHANE